MPHLNPRLPLGLPSRATQKSEPNCRHACQHAHRQTGLRSKSNHAPTHACAHASLSPCAHGCTHPRVQFPKTDRPLSARALKIRDNYLVSPQIAHRRACVRPDFGENKNSAPTSHTGAHAHMHACAPARLSACIPVDMRACRIG